MKKVKSFSALFFVLTVLVGTCLAQDADKSEPQKFYRLDFVVKELDGGKTVNSRAYFMTVAAPGKQQSQIRTISRVPFQHSPVPTGSWGQHELRTNFDCSQIKEVLGGLSLSVMAQVDTVLEESSAGDSGHPIDRSNEWNSTVVLPIRKPTVIFSSDDLASKRQMQVELMATPIN